MNLQRLLGALVALLFLALPVLAGTKDGVTMPDDVKVNGKKLVLNGMGLRTKSMFKVHVYVAGLYLPAKTDDAEKIVSTDEEKRLVMHFVHEVEKDSLVDAWKDGIEENVDKEVRKKLADRLQKLCDWMEDLKVGEEMTFTYIPKKGLEVKVKAEVKGTIEGWDFAGNFLKIWFGKEPPTEELKKELLGK